MDELMKSLYDPIRKSNSDVVLSQRDWLKYGRNRCSDRTCLEQTYELRIAQFRNREYLNWAEHYMPEMKAAGSLDSGITYQKTTTNYANVMEWLRTNKLLEASLAAAQTKYAYPSNLKLVARNCNQANAFYLWEPNVVAICYELVDQLFRQYFDTARTDPTVTEAQRLSRLFFSVHFIIQHELGHAALHNRYSKPRLGSDEGEADSFAFVSLITASRNNEDLLNMLWGVNKALELFRQDSLTIQVLTDEHDLSQRRYLTFACLAGGANPVIASELLKTGQFTQAQIRRCQGDWQNKKRAVEALLVPGSSKQLAQAAH